MTAQRLDWHDAQNLAAGTVLGLINLPAVTMTQLVYYCAAARVTDPIHYDRDFARRAGFPDAVVNGSLRIAWLTQAMSDFVEPPDFVSSLRCAHRGPMYVGQALSLEVRVTAPAENENEGCVLHCEVIGRLGDTVIDHAEGSLTLARLIAKPDAPLKLQSAI